MASEDAKWVTLLSISSERSRNKGLVSCRQGAGKNKQSELHVMPS